MQGQCDLTQACLRATLSGALAGLLFGFDTVVISGAIDALVQLYGLNPQEKGFTVAIGLVGTVIGALGAGHVGQRLGSRETLRITAVLYIASALGVRAGMELGSFMAFRFIGGLGIGASSVLGPVYIAELAPAKLRGRLVAAFQLNVVFGVMVAYISNYVIRTMHLGAAEWRWQVGIAAVPAVVFLALLFGIPRSPRWSVSKNRMDEALSVLKLMGDPDPEAELADIQAALGAGTRDGPRARIPMEVSLSAVSRHLDRRFQPACRHQRDSVLPEQYLRCRRASARSRATSRQSPLAQPTFCSPWSACR